MHRVRLDPLVRSQALSPPTGSPRFPPLVRISGHSILVRSPPPPRHPLFPHPPRRPFTRNLRQSRTEVREKSLPTIPPSIVLSISHRNRTNPQRPPPAPLFLTSVSSVPSVRKFPSKLLPQSTFNAPPAHPLSPFCRTRSPAILQEGRFQPLRNTR